MFSNKEKGKNMVATKTQNRCRFIYKVLMFRSVLGLRRMHDITEQQNLGWPEIYVSMVNKSIKRSQKTISFVAILCMGSEQKVCKLVHLALNRHLLLLLPNWKHAFFLSSSDLLFVPVVATWNLTSSTTVQSGIELDRCHPGCSELPHTQTPFQEHDDSHSDPKCHRRVLRRSQQKYMMSHRRV